MTHIEKIEFMGWQHCYRLANGIVELIVTADVGPRILHFSFVHDFNHLKIYEDTVGQTGDETWQMYGGHRFWHAPEVAGRTAYPDNERVVAEIHHNRLVLISPIESTTLVQKEIEIALDLHSTHVQVTHRLRNHNLWAIELAPWAITVVTAGGKAILPLSTRGGHGPTTLLPQDRLNLWAYTDMTDPRYTWGKKYILVRQDSELLHAQKIGVGNSQGWLGYVNAEQLFLKKVAYQSGANYPDFGSVIEVYTQADMLELETLAPLIQLEPTQSIEHIEHWYLFRDVPMPSTDADVDIHILPKVLSV